MEGSGEGRDLSVVRSFRLPLRLDQELQKEAEALGVSVNSLVTNILRRHLEWDRYADRFGYISAMGQEYGLLMESLNQKSLVELAQRVGAHNYREGVLFWFKEWNHTNFLSFLSIHSKYTRTAQFELVDLGGSTVVNLHHGFNKKYSLYLAESIRAALESEPLGHAEVTQSDNSVTLRLGRD